MAGVGPTSQNVTLGPPPRWLKCPRKGQIIASTYKVFTRRFTPATRRVYIISFRLLDKFVPFKTPLCDRYNEQIPIANRFTVEMLFSALYAQKVHCV